MRPEDAEEYTQALGQVVAGGWRQVALGKRLGVPQALGISTEAWVEQRLGGYIRMSIPERREAVKELTSPIEDGGEGMSTREAAEVLGVGKSVVDRDRKVVPDGTERPCEYEQDRPTSVPSGTDAPNAPACALVPDTEPEQSTEDLIDAAIGTIPGAHDTLSDLRFLQAVSKGVQAARQLFRLDPAATAELISDGDYRAIRLLDESAREWFGGLTAARAQELRLIEGGK